MKSVFSQSLPVHRVDPASLFDSPRNYNASICELNGVTWMAYRSHRMDEGGRCGIALCQLPLSGALSSQLKAKSSQWIDLPRPTGGEHHEDPRLFVFRGELHLAYVESRFYPKPQPYTCCLKYARLARTTLGRSKVLAWHAAEIYQPDFGRNDGTSYEKNWSFFDRNGVLHAIYKGEPHIVLELDGDEVVFAHQSEGGVVWPWGEIRGGTPPVKLPSGEWLTIFHSSLPGPQAPHWRRYFAAAYTFEDKPPFRITSISHRPLLAGSAADGHAHDPRNTDSWKPYVVFPGGLVVVPPVQSPEARVKSPAGSSSQLSALNSQLSYRVSYGINDYAIGVAHHTDLALGDPAFATWEPRCFLSENGTLPVRVWPVSEGPKGGWLQWERPRGRTGLHGSPGILRVTDPSCVEAVAAQLGVTEITAARYLELAGRN